jgi:hypothetical protein
MCWKQRLACDVQLVITADIPVAVPVNPNTCATLQPLSPYHAATITRGCCYLGFRPIWIIRTRHVALMDLGIFCFAKSTRR